MTVVPSLTHAFEIRAAIAPSLHIGHGDGERTEFTPITGGTVHGPRLNGTVLAGGGDWSSTRGSPRPARTSAPRPSSARTPSGTGGSRERPSWASPGRRTGTS
ncbi:hypothetical protein JCM4814A_49230 [Streptomyces phaeofaciens JCM 4814]|uniref:Uncharacterized protein n=1 Tax=Streptomyces phaeofaciens TaxID=68254 RepID=A0A918H4H1_9ACTN|nr:hypothetical protein GCM10010226_05890 [Streptomyces phaeofaciens]